MFFYLTFSLRLASSSADFVLFAFHCATHSLSWSVCFALFSMVGSTDDDEQYEGRTELLAWISWVDYFDQLVDQAHPVSVFLVCTSLC